MPEKDRKDIQSFFSEAEDEELKCLVSTQDSKGFLTWNEVSSEYEDFRIKTWGEAIESGAIEQESGDTFKLASRSEISTHLSDDGTIKQTEEDNNKNSEPQDLPEVDLDSARWKKKDVAVAGLGLVFMLGFQVSQIRSVVFAVMDVPLGFLDQFAPLFVVVFIASIFTSIWSHYVREGLHDVSIENFRDRISALQGGDDDGGILSNPEDVDTSKQNEIMKLQGAMMKSQMKPFGWILILTIPTILWFQATATGLAPSAETGTILFPIIGEKAWASSLFGPFQVWIFWYIICTVTLTQVVKKFYPMD